MVPPRPPSQGNANAQNNLGLMYRNGRGVPQDYVSAHMWLNLAAATGDEDARKARDIGANRSPRRKRGHGNGLTDSLTPVAARTWHPSRSPMLGNVDNLC